MKCCISRLWGFVLTAALLCSCVTAGADEDASRIIAIGDIHGDYDQFVELLKVTGLVNKRLRWSGGDTHLVQLGDIPDRGPDTRKVIDLLVKLEKAAEKKGGRITVLMGNHEMMNLTDDLRYVHPGEYAAFTDRNSKKRQAAYYQKVVAHLTNVLPEEERPAFDDAYREQWEAKYPLGYVEHRVAWAPTGKYGQWALERPTVAVVGDTLFVHGGISPKFAELSPHEINTRVRTAIINRPEDMNASILYDQEGPLWYRGWSRTVETSELQAQLDAVLAAQGVKRMVVAHHPLMPVVIPRFAGKLLMVDVGLSAHYGGAFSALSIQGDELKALAGKQWYRLPVGGDTEAILAYLDEVGPESAKPDRVKRYQEALRNPPQPEPTPVEQGQEEPAEAASATN